MVINYFFYNKAKYINNGMVMKIIEPLNLNYYSNINIVDIKLRFIVITIIYQY